MAERFAREGMRVVLADVEEQPLARAREGIERSGAEAIAVQADVSSWEAVQALAERTVDAFGAAHVVCNNAGVAAGGAAWDAPLADWSWVLGVNLWGVIHGIRAFVPRMIAQGEGHIVNTASIAGLITAPGMGPYCATKHAVVAISECLHQDLAIAGNGAAVHVSVVCPAWVKTNIADCDRNRPKGSPPRSTERSPQDQMLADFVRSAIAGGIPPEEVAEQVLSAILGERFWVLTHPRSERAVEKRMHRIVDGIPPEFDPSGA
jgi:NAD(P)-dependent dehydrogenase (short-subunit alcohol dehydrogenase family)